MTGILVIQGRKLSGEDIWQVQGLLAEHPEWGRTRLSEELCRLWDWRNALGRPKDMAARTLLLKLERSGPSARSRISPAMYAKSGPATRRLRGL